MPDFMIYVPSKGRATTALTCAQLDAAGMPYYLITTPHEAAAYQESYTGCILPLQQEGMRIGKVRNCILDHAAAHGYEWIWMLDDDIRFLLHRTMAGKEMVSFAALRRIEQQVKHLPVVQVGFRPNLSMVEPGEGLSYNGVMNQAVAFHMPLLGQERYDEHLYFCEDSEITIRLLVHGHLNVRLCSYGYGIHYNGPLGKPNAGGLMELYHTHSLLESMEELVQRYPDLVFIRTVADGTKKLRVRWGKFRSSKPKGVA
jgi:hypothetical protein